MAAERRRFYFAFLIVAALGLAAVHWRALERADHALLDLQFRLLRQYAPQPLERDVVLVGIDETTFASLREPFALWHPHLGRFLKGMAQAKPSVVAFDIVLPDRSYDFLLPDYDRQLLEGLAGLRGASGLVIAQSLDADGQPRSIFPPFASLVGANGIGSAAVCRDGDLVIRRFDGQCAGVPAETLLAARMAARLGIEQEWRGYINYALGDAIRYLPFHEVLEWLEKGEHARLEAAFRGKPVLVGAVIPYSDRHPLPVPLAQFEPENRLLPGVLLHVQALRSMMHHGFVQTLSFKRLMLLALAALAFWFGPSRLAKAALGGLAIIAFLGASLLLVWKGTYYPAVTLAALVLFSACARAAYDALQNARERGFLRDAFRSYVDPQILRDIMAGRINPGLHGTRQTICVMLCDVDGFAARADTMPSEEVVALLNEYFAAITAAVYHHGGTINRFEGARLIAFFGAPLPLPNAGKNALEAAQDMLAELDKLDRRLASQGRPTLPARIALHSGDVVLGYVGGSAHQEYTAIGEAVNVAARLLELGAGSGYPVLCSASVADAVGRAGQLQDLGPRALHRNLSIHLFGWQPPLLGRVSPLLTETA